MQSEIAVWYASEARVLSTSKFLVFDDRGTLRTTDGGLRFDGRKQTIRLSDIRRLALVHQRIPWKTYLLVNVPFFAILALQAAIGVSQGAAKGIEQGIAWLFALGGILFLLLLLNGFGLLIALQTKWIRVDHRVDSGGTVRSYFAVSSAFGWGGILGGTRQLYEELSEALRPSGAGTLTRQAHNIRRTRQSDSRAKSGSPTVSLWAVVSLIVGGISVPLICFFFPLFVTSPTAIVTGHVARYSVRRSGGQKSGAGLALAGLILGYGTLAVVILFLTMALVGPIEFTMPAS